MTQDSKKEKNKTKISVSQTEMEKAFRTHKSVWEKDQKNPNHSHKMVLFYAVECGLKAYYMKKKGLEFSSDANDSVHRYSHNLNELLKKLDLSPRIPNIGKNLESPLSAVHLHTAWRYGKILDNEEESLCIQKLTNILVEINVKLAIPDKIYGRNINIGV
ncbi:MAG: hypothetical protein ACM3SY_17680 [Candidatus Omnitrophota bacterium]